MNVGRGEVMEVRGSLGGEKNKNAAKQVSRTLEVTRSPWAIGYSMIFAIIYGLTPLGRTVILGNFVDAMISEPSIGKINKFLVEFLVFDGILAIAVSGMFFGTSRLTSDITDAMSLKLFRSILYADIEYFDSHQTGEILSKLSEDIAIIQFSFGTLLAQAVFWGTQILGAIVIAAIFDWPSAFVVLIPIAVSVVAMYTGQTIEDKFLEKRFAQSMDSLSKAREAISAIKIVKSFDCELKEAEEFDKELMLAEKTAKSIAKGKGVVVLIIALFFWGAIALVVWLLASKVIDGADMVGALVIVASALIFTKNAVGYLGGAIMEFRKGGIAASKVWNINDMIPKIKPKEGATYSDVKGHIEVKNVNFTYPDRPEVQIFFELCMNIPQGKTVAVVGESGSGKSTILALIQRFYDVNTGQILFDGHDIRDLSPEFIHHIVTIVPQNPVLFSMSISDNISYGKPSASLEEIKEAARTANCEDFIENLPEKYSTIVTPTSLSGGERQRICIARAVLLNSPILLLDEATASLDATSEQLVQEAINRALIGRTTIIVAHRLTTIRNADIIFVMKKGKIVESGNHEALLSFNGEYTALIAAQL